MDEERAGLAAGGEAGHRFDRVCVRDRPLVDPVAVGDEVEGVGILGRNGGILCGGDGVKQDLAHKKILFSLWFATGRCRTNLRPRNPDGRNSK